jgi:NTP pyrophosphatase (non-canonical NTP hydrolase)
MINEKVERRPIARALADCQRELKPWQKHNFPNSQPFEPLLGIVEEVGELQMADNKKEMDDAIADILVYLCDYANRFNIDAVVALNVAMAQEVFIDITAIVGKLCHYHLKCVQGIRYTSEEYEMNRQLYVGRIILWLVEQHGDSYVATCLETEWAKVRQRDWQKNKLNADKVVDGIAPSNS